MATFGDCSAPGKCVVTGEHAHDLAIYSDGTRVYLAARHCNPAGLAAAIAAGKAPPEPGETAQAAPKRQPKP